MQRDTELKLIRAVQSGNEQALIELVEKYRNLINAELRKIRFLFKTNEDYEDLFQDAVVLLCNNIHKYDPNKGSFGVFYKVILKNYFCTKARAEQAYTRKANHYTFELDSNPEGADVLSQDCLCDGCIKNNPDLSFKHKELLEIISEILKDCSYEERQYLIKKVQGYTYQEIADIYDVSAKKVDNVLTKIRKKIKDNIKY